VQNLTEKRVLAGDGVNDQTTFNSIWFNYVKPRTTGLNFEKSF